MVDDTRFADVAAVNGDHVEGEDIADMADGSSSFPTFEGRPSGLEPCGICGRTFLPESLARHAPICQRNATKGNRKQFDMAKQRLSELEISQINADSASQTKRGKENTPVSANQEKPNWRVQHDELRENIRNAREITKAVKEGKPLPHPTKPTGPRPGYMQCEYCERHFSKTAAERHIEFCKEQKNRLIQPQVDNNALTRLMARTKYKAPKLKTPGTPARVASGPTGLKPPTATPGILSNQQQCQSAGSSPVTIRKTREDKDSSVRRRHHTLSPLTASRRSELTPRYFDDDSDEDELTSDKSWRGSRGVEKGRNTDSGGGGTRLKKASSDKGLEAGETSERSKGESETASGSAGASRMNRMSYPTTAAKGPLRRKRSSSRLAVSASRGSSVKPRDVSPAGSASSANSGSGGFCLKPSQPSIPPPIKPPADSDIPGTSGPESPPIINRSQSFPDKQLLRRYHPSLQQPPGAAVDSAASGCESTTSAAAGERRSWSASNALPPPARGQANDGGNNSRSQPRPQSNTKTPTENAINGLSAGRTGTKPPSGAGTANTPRRSRIAKQTKETRFAQRAGGDFDSRMTASVPPGADLDFGGSTDVGSNIIPINASMTASAYFPQREGQLKLPPLPPSSSDGDLGYLSNNSDGGVGNCHGQGLNGGEVGGEAILAKFCHSCGTRFPISWARFCCMCGEKRLWMNPADKLPPI